MQSYGAMLVFLCGLMSAVRAADEKESDPFCHDVHPQSCFFKIVDEIDPHVSPLVHPEDVRYPLEIFCPGCQRHWEGEIAEAAVPLLRVAMRRAGWMFTKLLKP